MQSTKAVTESKQHADAIPQPGQNHKRKRLISHGEWKARMRLLGTYEDEDEDTSEEDEEDDDLSEDEDSLPVKYKVDTIDFATKVYDIQPRRKTIPIWESLRYRHHIDLPNDERVYVDDIIRVGYEGFAKILEIRYDREEGGCLVLIQWLYDKDDIIDLLRSRGRSHLYAVTEGVGRHRILPSDHFQLIDQDDITETADLRGKRLTVSWYFTCAWEGMEEWMRSDKFRNALDKQLDASRRRWLFRSALAPPNYFNRKCVATNNTIFSSQSDFRSTICLEQH